MKPNDTVKHVHKHCQGTSEDHRPGKNVTASKSKIGGISVTVDLAELMNGKKKWRKNKGKEEE